MNPSSPSTSTAQRDSGTSENFGARKPSDRAPAEVLEQRLPAASLLAELVGLELGERHVVPPVEGDLVAGAGDVAHEVGARLGELADDEERAAHGPLSEERQHGPRDARDNAPRAVRRGRWSSRSSVKVMR